MDEQRTLKILWDRGKRCMRLHKSEPTDYSRGRLDCIVIVLMDVTGSGRRQVLAALEVANAS